MFGAGDRLLRTFTKIGEDGPRELDYQSLDYENMVFGASTSTPSIRNPTFSL
jgi:hypothetical protein